MESDSGSHCSSDESFAVDEVNSIRENTADSTDDEAILSPFGEYWMLLSKLRWNNLEDKGLRIKRTAVFCFLFEEIDEFCRHLRPKMAIK